MAEGVGAGVAELRRIGGGAKAKGIQDCYQCAQWVFSTGIAAKNSLSERRKAKGRIMTDIIADGVAAAKKAFPGAFPRTALVLGSGLGAFAETLTDATDISYADLPGFPVSTVAGHAGKLRIGTGGGLAAGLPDGALPRL